MPSRRPAPLVVSRPAGERAAEPVPAGQGHPALRPREDPRDRPQVGEAHGGAATGGAAADVEPLDLVEGRRRAQVAHEGRGAGGLGRVVHEAAVGPLRERRQLVQGLLPGAATRGAARGPTAAGHEHGVDELLEVAPREGGVRVAVRDRLALLREPQAPPHRLRRLGEDRAVRRAAATAHRPAPPVEEGERDPLRPADRGERALRAVQLPVRGEVAAVLVGVAVPHHDRLRPAAGGEVPGVGGVREEPLHRRRRRVEVGHRLEEGDHVETAFDSRVPGHQEDREQVARPARHAHHVALDRGGADPLVGAADEAEEVEGLVRAGAEVEPVRREGPAGLDLRGQEARPLVLARLGVRRRDAVAAEHLRDRARVPRAVLPQVEARQVEAEDLGLPHEGRQAAGGQPLRAVRGAGFAAGGRGPPAARPRRRRCRGGRGGRPATAGCSPPVSSPACGRRTAASVGRAAGGSAPRPASPPPGRGRRLGAGSRRAPRRPRAARWC